MAIKLYGQFCFWCQGQGHTTYRIVPQITFDPCVDARGCWASQQHIMILAEVICLIISIVLQLAGDSGCSTGDRNTYNTTEYACCRAVAMQRS